ncbi:MAG TPA: EamA family transporter [Kiloniellaceae bacterium]|nr:EamA family transporter [Kiloniellaceae bacterium]
MAFRLRDIFILVGVIMIWGGNFAVVKIGLQHFTPLFFIALRFALVALFLLPVARAPRGRFLHVFALSWTLGVIHFALMFTGLKTVDAATAAIAVQLQVPMASLLAWLVFKDKLGWRRAIGMLLAFAGVGVIVGGPNLEGQYLGLGLVVSAAFMWAVANVQIKLMGNIDGKSLNAWVGVFAAPQLLALSLLLESGQWQALATLNVSAVFAVLYQSLAVMVVGYGIWYSLMRRYDMNQVMPFTLLLPVFGVLAGVLVLGEEITLTFLLGGVLTLIGVGIIVIRRPKIAAPETQRM